jgi:hypothetical protein
MNEDSVLAIAWYFGVDEDAAKDKLMRLRGSTSGEAQLEIILGEYTDDRATSYTGRRRVVR